MIKISLSEDFTKIPGGRYIRDGAYSGEKFKDEILKPKYLEAIKKNEKLEINLDGCYGYPSSFLDESFGGLARELKDKNILENIELISLEQPNLIDQIREYVKEALN